MGVAIFLPTEFAEAPADQRGKVYILEEINDMYRCYNLFLKNICRSFLKPQPPSSTPDNFFCPHQVANPREVVRINGGQKEYSGSAEQILLAFLIRFNFSCNVQIIRQKEWTGNLFRSNRHPHKKQGLAESVYSHLLPPLSLSLFLIVHTLLLFCIWLSVSTDPPPQRVAVDFVNIF